MCTRVPSEIRDELLNIARRPPSPRLRSALLYEALRSSGGAKEAKPRQTIN